MDWMVFFLNSDRSANATKCAANLFKMHFDTRMTNTEWNILHCVWIFYANSSIDGVRWQFLIVCDRCTLCRVDRCRYSIYSIYQADDIERCYAKSSTVCSVLTLMVFRSVILTLVCGDNCCRDSSLFSVVELNIRHCSWVCSLNFITLLPLEIITRVGLLLHWTQTQLLCTTNDVNK